MADCVCILTNNNLELIASLIFNKVAMISNAPFSFKTLHFLYSPRFLTLVKNLNVKSELLIMICDSTL